MAAVTSIPRVHVLNVVHGGFIIARWVFMVFEGQAWRPFVCAIYGYYLLLLVVWFYVVFFGTHSMVATLVFYFPLVTLAMHS